MLGLQQKFVNNIDGILGLNKPKRIGIAVSGGADSVALLHLAVLWSKINKLEITVFSVDHNLRPESKAEIAHVKNLANKFGFGFVPLFWDGGSEKSAIQARARKARYSLIQEHSKSLGVSLMLTAHHFDDMLETYLIKKSKKSSILALTPNITHFIDNMWVVRPLFNITKKDLMEYLLQNNIHWFEDASNSSDKYERSRVRKNIAALDIGQKTALINEYNLVIDKAKKIGSDFIAAFAETVSIYNYGFAKIDLAKFAGLDKEVKIHLLNHILTIISGKTIIPRYRSLSKIINSIDNNAMKASTLSSCKLVSKNKSLIIYKEKASITQNEDEFKNQIFWDQRFQLTTSDDCDQLRFLKHKDCMISNLEMADYVKLKKNLDLKKLAEISNNSHKAILFTLPVIKNLEKVIAIPHISYYDGGLNDNINIKASFCPKFISRFTHFF